MEGREPVNGVFLSTRLRPRLVRCALLLVDLLGVREMARGPNAENELRRLDSAVSGLHHLMPRRFLDPEAQWPAALFSDTFVVSVPILPGDDDRGAVAQLIELGSQLQLAILNSHFFVRGAITLGDFHISEGIVFGAALIEGVDLERDTAINPRIVLSEEARHSQRPGGGRSGRLVSQQHLLLRDSDGQTFVNYLARLLEDIMNPVDDLTWHRDLLAESLAGNRTKKRNWEKYRWAAEYHNAFVERTGKDPDLLVPAQAMTWQFGDPFP
jgi:hypothetical protein